VTRGGPDQRRADGDAAKAIRFMAIKGAIFILLPLAIAALVVFFTLK